MIESPKNFIEQFQNFIEHIAGVMKTFLTKEVADNYYLSFTAQTLSETVQTQVLTNLGVIGVLKDLITEYGGTVPTDSNTQSVQTLSANDDPWSEFN